jgi:hypothetical protein
MKSELAPYEAKEAGVTLYTWTYTPVSSILAASGSGDVRLPPLLRVGMMLCTQGA